jgi:hypothetical protein
MTIAPRSLRTLCAVRTRLRDAAAADHAAVAHARAGAADALAAESAALSESLDAAAGELATARTIHDLMGIAAHAGEQRRAVAAAAARDASAAAENELSAARLRGRERQLRVAERLLDRVEYARARRESRADQRANDDLAGRRR